MMQCYIFRISDGLWVELNFNHFETEETTDTLKLYEGVGSNKRLTGKLIILSLFTLFYKVLLNNIWKM